MPRINRRLRARANANLLTDRQEMDLLLGNMGEFATNRDRQKAWRAHDTELMAQLGAGIRPAAFWDYDSPAPKLKRETDYAALRRLGIATAQDLAAAGRYEKPVNSFADTKV